jgi:NAD(P)H-hydrate epimerase
LSQRGAAVAIIEASDAPDLLPHADLVIDSAYGTGFRGSYKPPDPGHTPVLACDIPSGIDGDTGRASDAGAVQAARTVTFGAWKPGLLLGDGPAHGGEIHVEPIGLDCSRATTRLVEDNDVSLLPPRARTTHKYAASVAVIAGSPTMAGAARLVTEGALRAGAGYVRLGSPGRASASGLPVTEAVGLDLPAEDWSADALEGMARMKAAAIGPGLGQTGATATSVAAVLRETELPIVVDADGLHGLEPKTTASRAGPTVLTPHDGEFERLTGAPPGDDRIATVVDAAARFGCVVLLKGSTTVVADPTGTVRIAAAGSSRLATAGTGDVLTGIIGAFLARGVAPLDAAVLAAHVHGRAAGLGQAVGMVAGDLPRLVSRWLSSVGTVA